MRQLVASVAINNDAQDFSQLLQQDGAAWHHQIWREFESDFNALTALQQAILSQLVSEGRGWSPFSEQSLQNYQQATGQANLSISTVQTAIQSLREQGFIWQSSRGVYALEDDSFAQWFGYRQPQ